MEKALANHEVILKPCASMQGLMGIVMQRLFGTTMTLALLHLTCN